MGELYLTDDPIFDRYVVIKVLRAGFDGDQLRQRFAREARSATPLAHVNIAAIFDVGEHEGRPYLAMEYVPGETLSEIIRRKTELPLGTKLNYIDELCAGLAHAHRAGIVHRDIKPSQLMVSRDGTLKILDFGVARFTDSSMTGAGMAMATLNYMSPEQITGKPIDHRAATPHRTAALRVLRDGLASGSRAVNDAVPAVAAFLDVMVAVPRVTLEDEPAEGEGAARLRERMRLYPCRLSFWQREALAAGLRGNPADVARASVAFTDDAPPHCPPAPPVDVARVLPPVFDRLDPAQRQRMLSYRWGHVAGPAMLPVLRRLISTPDVDPETRDIALVRLGELAPTEARRVSRENVTTGRFRFSSQALRLASADIPAVTEALARHLADARAESTPLSELQHGQGVMARGLLPTVVRLATPDTCALLVEWPQGEPISCASRASVLACALAADRNSGLLRLREHLSDGRSRCGDTLPETLARRWPQYVSEGALVDALWHERPGVAVSAARALAYSGSSAARGALWSRLDAWHARWAGRADELRVTTPTIDNPVVQELGLERALRDAILRGRRWITMADDRLRVRESCVTEACRDEFSPFLGGSPVRLVVVEAEEWTGQTVYRVEGQAFDALPDVMERLVLYPKTVTIAWRAGSSHAPARAAVLYKALATAASRRGLTILAQPPAVTP